MAIKRKGIVAVPGEFKYGDLIEIKTAEELKDAAERHPIIPLTYRHPIDIYPKASETIGTLSQKWDEENQRVNGEFWFYDERTPEDIKMKLANNEPIPISGGILIDDIEDGIQKGIVYTHMAILGDRDDPKCPLGTCGVNVRMEADSKLNVRHEQSTEIEAPEEEAEPVKEEVPEPDEVKEPEPEPEEPKTDEPAEQKPEAEVEPEPVEEVKLVPEVVIPVGETVPKEWEVDERGWIHFYPHKKLNKEK